jgi:hypothetical protein
LIAINLGDHPRIVTVPTDAGKSAALAIVATRRHIKSMRIVMGLIVTALMALLFASIYYAYGIWNALESADMPGWMYAAMAGGVIFSLLVGGLLMGLVFYSNRAGYDDEAARNDR